MAVVPDRRIAITHKLKMLKTNQAIVTAALEKLLAHMPSAMSSSVANTKLDPDNGDVPIELDEIKSSESPLADPQFMADNFQQFAIKENLKVRNIQQITLFLN